MKERYVKPAIYMESFALTQTIARNCGDTHDPASTVGESTHYSPNACTWDIFGYTLFYDHCMENMTPKDGKTIDEMLEGAGFCYNNPNGLQTVFSST